MVEQLELADQTVKFIAELIDLLLTNLIPSWKPCVCIDHLIPQNGVKACRVHHEDPKSEKEESVVRPQQNVCEVVGGSFSNQDFPHPSSCKHSSQLTKVMSHRGCSMQSSTIMEDQCSEMSYASATSYDMNFKNCSMDSYSSAEAMPFISSRELKESHFALGTCASSDYKAKPTDKESIDSHLSSFSSFYREENEELRMELQKIELQYRQGIEEACRRRNEAILETRKKLSHKR